MEGNVVFIVVPYTYTLLPNGAKFLVPWYLTLDHCTLGFYCMDVGGIYHLVVSRARSLCDN